MSQARRLHGLDAMRGIAALAVCAFHLPGIYPAFPAWFGKGYLAVDFFMMLSGYVMARTYEARLRGGLGTGQFVFVRYQRLWLTMAVGSLIGIGYLWSATAGDPAWFALGFALNIMLLPAPVNNELTPLNSPGWSIFYELVANAVHAAFLWRLSNRALVGVIAVLLIPLAIFARMAGDLDFGALTVHAGPAVVRSLASYSIGVLLWRLWQDEPPLAVPPFFAMIVLPLLMSSSLPGFGWLFDLAFILVLCPILIAGGLCLRSAPRWAVWSGMVSFPLYAVHMSTFRASFMAGLGPWTALLIALTAAVLLTWWLSARERRGKARSKI
jgi:peptidoglycan/LPS O-acetylase OafA/YrhL